MSCAGISVLVLRGGGVLPMSLVMLLLLASCGPGPHRPAMQGTPVRDLVARANAANTNGGLSSEALLTGITPVPVEGFGGGFAVAARSGAIERFPCSRCHSVPLAQMKRAAPGQKAAHWEISLQHAPAGVMSCDTCHQGQPADSLHTLRGLPVAFDHSYQLCAQCHSRQAKDWAGGAHGKRLGGWAPPRVVASCTSCHNPHAPQLKSRWPAIAAKTENTESHQ